MLNPAENEMLTRVGPGTPGGELMRRYWQPITGSSYLRKKKVVPIRILGEDLVLYRDLRGQIGLIDHVCAHRRVDLANGYPVESGLRCPYHGWTYGATGHCIAQPGEPADSPLKDKVKLKSYPVQELGGLVFAYLGPEPAPLLPRWDYLVDDRMLRQIGFVIAPYNWLQGMENSYDATHAEWLHGHFFKYALDEQGDPDDPRYEINVMPFMRRHEDFDYERVPYGFIRRVVLEGDRKDADTYAVGHAKIFPNITTINAGGTCISTYQIPVDDTHTLYIGHRGYRFPDWVQVPRQDDVPWFEIPTRDQNGEWIRDDIVAQDIMVMTAQGPILDRSREWLGTTDMGIVKFRRLLKDQIELVRGGGEPMNVYRDLAGNRRLALPHSTNFYERGMFGRGTSYRRGSATGALGMQNSPINDLIEDLFEEAARGAPAMAK
ncbi:MAG TPA: aromatic ring-hydroxylating dioxygenase subunit alpha [Alphaproteobacteria bacterium]